MVKIRGLIFLAISLAIGFTGCGESSNGYGIFRSRDIITVFVPIRDTSEIAEVKVNNKALHVDIDTGKKIETRVIRLERRVFQIVEPDETLEIHGRNRINDYAVIHLTTTAPAHKAPKFQKLSSYRFYDGFKITKARKKPEPFENSGAFRFGDKIMAYCRLQDDMHSRPKTFKINIGSVEIKHTNTVKYKEIITEEKSGHPILILEKHDTDSDTMLRNLRFLLKDLGPDETVKIEEVKNLGSRIVIAELAVVPRENQPLNDVILRDNDVIIRDR